MNLKRLCINHFGAIASADIHFKRRLSIIRGHNNQGKSSIKDALAWGLTGVARGIKNKNKMLAMGGLGGDMGVILDYLSSKGEEGVITRTLSRGPTGSLNPALPYALDGSEFVALAAKDRAKVLSLVMGGEDELTQKAIDSVIGEIDPAVMRMLNGESVILTDLKKFGKEIIACRQHWKRELTQCQSGTGNPADFNLDPAFELAPATLARSAAQARIDEIQKQAREADRAEVKRERLESLQKQLKDTPKGRKPAAVKPDPRLDTISRALSLADKLVTLADADKCEEISCPICGGATIIADLITRVSEVGDQNLKKIEDAKVAWTKVAEYEQTQRQREAIESEITAIEKALKDAPESVDSTDEIAKLRVEADGHTSQIKAFELYRKRCTELQANADKAPEYERLIEECNRIDEALKDGGEVKGYITKHAKQLPLSLDLCNLWFPPEKILSWKEDGTIDYDGRPVEIASASEQYRVSAVMSLALAELGGIGFACLDGYEVLVGQNAAALIKVADKIGLNNILVFASSDKPAPKPPKGVEIHHIEGGAVISSEYGPE